MNIPILNRIGSLLVSGLPRLTRPLQLVSIRTKILILPAVALAALAMSAVVTWSLARINSTLLTDFSGHTLPTLSAVSDVNVGLVSVQALYSTAVGDKDEFELEDANAAAAKVRTALEDIGKKEPTYEKRIKDLLAMYDHYTSASSAAIKGVIDGKADMQTLQTMAKDKEAAYGEVHKALQKLVDESKADALGKLNGASRKATG